MANKILIRSITIAQLVLLVAVFSASGGKKKKSNYHYSGRRNTFNPYTKTMCMDMQNTLRARHKTCFLRADTGPCRADIIQWYYDVKQKRCYRFFWGGCQGNGNRFETRRECMGYCFLNMSAPVADIPHFCTLAFDFGTCFGQFNRWAWDKFSKTCKLRLYSGCGGNQNNFESRSECLQTCLSPPNITLQRQQLTTCFPFDISALQQ